MVLISLTWLFLAYYIKGLFPLNPDFRELLLATQNWRVLGISKVSEPLLSLPLYIVTNPIATLKAILFDYHIKFLYIILLLGPLLFLPLKSKYFLSSLTLLLFFITSNFRPYYMIGSQYPLILVPFLFIAFVDALQSNSFKYINAMILASLLFSISTSPISPLSQEFVKETPILWYPKLDLIVNDRVVALHEILRLISGQRLSTNTKSHISSRGKSFRSICHSAVYWVGTLVLQF